ncbi:MAG: hypothetical protein NT131_05975 [Methanomassiliicoccales archaeon]|nr:hypothetical protein [Methanomassiliicoccales archaeon]
MTYLFDHKTYIEAGEIIYLNANIFDVRETAYRSAVGRYYYGCHLEARAKLFSPKYWDVKDEISHIKVIEKLEKRDPVIGGYLRKLFELRKHADYHTWPEKTVNNIGGYVVRCQCPWDSKDPEKSLVFAQQLAGWIMEYLSTI